MRRCAVVVPFVKGYFVRDIYVVRNRLIADAGHIDSCFRFGSVAYLVRNIAHGSTQFQFDIQRFDRLADLVGLALPVFIFGGYTQSYRADIVACIVVYSCLARRDADGGAGSEGCIVVPESADGRVELKCEIFPIVRLFDGQVEI